jgi:hypothetical protein
LANVLYGSLDELVVAFRRGDCFLTGDRSRVGFMFDHDDPFPRKQTKDCRIAA